MAALWMAWPVLGRDVGGEGLLPPVHPRFNVEKFEPVRARAVRMTILRTSVVEPCLDELEVYGPDAPGENLALSERGARARASGTLEQFRIHALEHVNDGLYGNSRSWICDSVERGWVEIELAEPARVDRIVWSRDREGQFIDRLPVEYRFEVEREEGGWVEVASSERREAAVDGAAPINPALRLGVNALPWGAVGPAGERVARAVSGIGRDYVATVWRAGDGLPSNSVTALLQTGDDWLWVGTTHGLARFDGVKFTVFCEVDGLPAPSIGALCEDGEGRLWVGTTGGGVARWDGERFVEQATGDSGGARTVVALEPGSGATVWVATLDGLFRCGSGEAVRVAEGAIQDVVYDAGRGEVLYCREGLWRTDGGESEEVDPTIERSRFSSLAALAYGEDGSVWFGGGNRYIGRLIDGEVEVYAEDAAVLTSTVRVIDAGGGDGVWLGTAASGLLRLGEERLEAMTTEDGLPANGVLALCRDGEGNLWVGTHGGGLVRVARRRVDVLTTADGLSHQAVMALATEGAGGGGEVVWIGTNGGGLNRWRVGDGEVSVVAPSYVLDNETVSALERYERDGGVAGLWVGTAFSGLARLEGEEFEIVVPRGDPPGHAIGALADDGEGLWIGTPAGLYYLGGDGECRPVGGGVLEGVEVTALALDTGGVLWVGTGGRGVVCRMPGGVVRHWTVADGLPGSFVRALHFDHGGRLWAGTSGGLAWLSADGVVEAFGEREGIAEALVVAQVQDDGAGHLWLGTNRGVLRVALASLEAVAAGGAQRLDVFALGLGDGLPSLECSAGCHPGVVRLADGRMCFATVGGLAVIDPGRFGPLPAPPVVLEEVEVSSKAGRAEALRVRFAAPGFTAPDRVRFRWMVEGLDDGWGEPSAERSVRYRHLPPGSYLFKVAASREGGPWSEPAASVAVSVPSPWWRRPWLGVLAVLFGGAVVAWSTRALARRRMRARLVAVEQAFALERERSRIAQDIHDTLGANLTRITLHSALGREESGRGEADGVGGHFEAISETADEIVRSLDGIVWAVNPAHDTLESLVRYLMRSADEFCADLPVRMRLDVPDEMPVVVLRSEVRHNVFLAVREALNNAVRHGQAAEVWLRLSVSGGDLQIVVEDDGGGMDPERRGTGHGLSNMRRRLAECGGTCEIRSDRRRGVSVQFSVPLGIDVEVEEKR